MRVLHVIEKMDPKHGGVCQAVRSMIIGLHEQKGVQNEVVSLDAADATYLQQDLFPIHAIGTGQGPWRYSAKLLPWLLDNLSRFEVVIVHGLWTYHSYAVQKALRQLKKQQRAGQLSLIKLPRLFIMPHGMLDPYFQRAPDRKLKALRNWLYWKVIEAKLVNEAVGLLFTCAEEQRLAREPFYPYQPKKEEVIGLGVEKPPVYNPGMKDAFLEHCPELQQESYLLFLSRIHPKKGVDLLLHAYAALVRQVTKEKEANLAVSGMMEKEFSATQMGTTSLPKLVIAGPGLHTPYGARMQQLVHDSPELRNAVYFPGMLTGEAKWGAFYRCEAFILPSHQENFGIAVVEALACGKPVLISNQVNIWREIQAAGAGLVADDTLTGTQKLLADWLKLSIDEKQIFKEQAIVSFRQNFEIKSTTNQLVKAIR